MIDIAVIRQDPDWVREQILKLQDEAAAARIPEIVRLDEERRELIQKRDSLQAIRNRLNKSLGRLRGDKRLTDDQRLKRAWHAAEAVAARDYERAETIMNGELDDELSTPDETDFSKVFDHLLDKMRSMSDHHSELEDEVRSVASALDEHMLWVPNLPHESVPVGTGEEDNVPWEPEGEARTFDFEPKPHWDLGVELDMIDFDRGVKLSGSRFYILKGWGARLQRALIQFYLDQAREKGFTELYVPYLIREEMLVGAGQFPKFTDVVYSDPDAGLYLLPTSEVAITNILRDEIVNEADLPLYYVAQSACFRREKAAAGKDTRGIKRVHQFEKVEMFKFTTPETSYDELESLTEAAEDLCRLLGLRFRRLEISTGDLGFTASKKYDVEVWAPGSEEWLEVSSCSNTEAFQARRAMVRYYPEGEKRTQFVHTLNGSGLAVPRVIIAIMENYQQADGSITVPEVLRPYLGGIDRIPPVD